MGWPRVRCSRKAPQLAVHLTLFTPTLKFSSGCSDSVMPESGIFSTYHFPPPATLNVVPS
jgi:hypothetical protein